MKKSLLSLCVLLVLAIVIGLFILPYGLGFAAKSKYSQLLDMFGKSTGLQVTLLDYQRGWFSSEAKVKVAIPISNKQILLVAGKVPPLEQSLIVKQHIEHGPLFSLPLKKDEPPRLAWGQTLITTHIHSPLGVIEMVNWIKLNGAVWGTVNAPALLYTNAQSKEQLEIQNFWGVFEMTADLRQFIAEAHVPKMALKMSFFEQQAEQIKLAYRLQKSDSGLFLGEHRLTIDSMDWNTVLSPVKWKFAGLKVAGYDEEKKGKINNLVDAELDAVLFNSASFGPQRLVLAINQLDVPALLALRKESNNLRNADASENAFIKYRQLFMALLHKGLEIQLKKLEIATPWGTPKMVAHVVLLPQVSGEDTSLIDATQGSVELNVPATFLMRALEKINALSQNFADTSVKNNTVVAKDPKAPPILSPVQAAQQQVTEWVSKKWLLPKDNGYQTVIVRQNQQTTINGQPLKVGSPFGTDVNLSY